MQEITHSYCRSEPPSPEVWVHGDRVDPSIFATIRDLHLPLRCPRCVTQVQVEAVERQKTAEIIDFTQVGAPMFCLVPVSHIGSDLVTVESRHDTPPGRAKTLAGARDYGSDGLLLVLSRSCELREPR